MSRNTIFSYEIQITGRTDKTNFPHGIRGSGILCLVLSLSLLGSHGLYLSSVLPATIQAEEFGIIVDNRSDGTKATEKTKLNAGYSDGDILNFHFFPGLEDFNRGNYRYALGQMDFFLERPRATSMHPKQSDFMTTAYYIRGTIYLDHAHGVGRLERALDDFRAALQWKPENYPALLAIARVNLYMGKKIEAENVLRSLLEKQPPEAIQAEAADLLKKLITNGK